MEKYLLRDVSPLNGFDQYLEELLSTVVRGGYPEKSKNIKGFLEAKVIQILMSLGNKIKAKS